MSPETTILLLNAAVIAIAYALVYPRFAGANITKLAWVSASFRCVLPGFGMLTVAMPSTWCYLKRIGFCLRRLLTSFLRCPCQSGIFVTTESIISNSRHHNHKLPRSVASRRRGKLT